MRLVEQDGERSEHEIALRLAAGAECAAIPHMVFGFVDHQRISVEEVAAATTANAERIFFGR